MTRGRLRIYLGAAPGVGKTYAMLNEGRRRQARGSDVVVAYVETHGRPNTATQIGDLEVIGRARIHYRGAEFEEMDVDAVIARHPAQALVDELAHTNVPGSRNEKRWQDVEEILKAGIDVISTVNVQHLESLNNVVQQITGVEQHETIPDAVVRGADQVELVDMTPEALQRRMAHGNIYAPEKVDAALSNYFRPGNLAALRELALMWLADRVDEALQEYREAHGIEHTWETRERVVVALTGAPGGDDLIRRAARMAMRARGELLGAHIRPSDGLTGPSPDGLAPQRELLVSLGGVYHEITGADVASTLVRFAEAENATQLFLGASKRSRWAEFTRGSVINRVLRASGSIDVHVISTPAFEGDRAAPTVRTGARRVRLSARRIITAWALAIVGPPVLTVVLSSVRSDLTLPSDLLCFLLLVVVVAAVGGLLASVVAAALAFVLTNWFFTPPLHRLTIAHGENVLALTIFLAVAGVVSLLVAVAARRSSDALRARAEAETLATLSGTVVASADPLPNLLAQLQAVFEADAVAVLRRDDDRWEVEAAAGEPVPACPGDGTVDVPVGAAAVLVVSGPVLADEDLEALRSFAGQVRIAVEHRRLQADARRAAGLEEANELRTAILAAVSHDLRSPLASIKASVTSLLQGDVRWTPEQTDEFLKTIDQESDRLNRLVGNLLDMSRLQAGALQLVVREVGLDEVVPRALADLPERAGSVVLDVPESLPRVRVDAALLERAIANVVDNARVWSPPGVAVRVEAGAVADRVDLRVVDHGLGVPFSERDRIFQPFQRLGDQPSGGAGVGLGLAVARGFVEAMGGHIDVEDTPSGGLTMVLRMPAVPESGS